MQWWMSLMLMKNCSITYRFSNSHVLRHLDDTFYANFQYEIRQKSDISDISFRHVGSEEKSIALAHWVFWRQIRTTRLRCRRGRCLQAPAPGPRKDRRIQYLEKGIQTHFGDPHFRFRIATPSLVWKCFLFSLGLDLYRHRSIFFLFFQFNFSIY
jgi:hypothetical protein